ncbi:hypothetical protein P3X46_002867 [Hevea brasiliensis]|uniref:Heparanase-like protein 2 n=1 Tax=Hevea brasiliensis TaxID=3981 RepID=A0ABQ9N651_HEVBR|nr:hypothetical protein P3X46_002867 [Hevea brasiliensis]
MATVKLRSFSALSIFLLSYFLCFAAAEDVRVTVRGVTSVAKTDDTFICATLDWWPSTKCDYGQCPWGQAGILNLDLNNKILANAIRAFGNLRIRIGGSLQDQVVYQVGHAVKKFPHFKRNDTGLFGFTRGSLPMHRWNQLNKLFNQTGVKLTFGLNALFGKHKSSDSDLWLGNWNPKNARDLMEYTIFQGHKIDSYELGNELCASGVSARLDAVQYSKDIIVLKKLVDKLYPDPKTRPAVLGPAGFYDQQWFNTFFEATGPNVIQGVTHHIYNLGPGDPYFLDQVAQTYRDLSVSINEFAPWAGPWVGESGGAFNSGGKDVSHTFANGFWYLDQLGMTSTFNHKVFCRQALIGGNYGLLNTTSFIPNPDYYGALLWHRLMGKEVLVTTHDTTPYLRAYSHCSRNKPGISLLLINMSNQTTFSVTVENDDNLYPSSRKLKNYIYGGTEKREEYHLTPKDGNIQSDVVLLNGTPLKLTSSLDIPEMKPIYVDSSSPITIAPDSFVYVTIKDFKAPACA